MQAKLEGLQTGNLKALADYHTSCRVLNTATLSSWHPIHLELKKRTDFNLNISRIPF